MSTRLRIVAIAGAVVAIWWGLWQAIDSPVPRGPVDREADVAPATETAEGIAEEVAEAADLDAEPRESLVQSAEATTPSAEGRNESKPETPGIRLLGALTVEREQTAIGGASLQLLDGSWEEKTARSDSQGEYGFEGLHPGTWELTVEAPGCRTLRRSVELVSEEPDCRLDLALARGDVLKVRIVGGATLDSPMLQTWSRSQEVEGMHEIVPLATREEPGKWVQTEADGGPSTVGVFLKRTGRHAGRSAGTVGEKGLEWHQGRWHPRVEIPARGDAVPRFPDGKTVDELSPEFCGAFVLSEPLPAFASLVFRDIVLKSQIVPEGADEVAFELSREELKALSGVVRLRVVDGDTELPPAGLQVRLDQRLAGRRRTLRTADGSITYEDVLPGSALLTITADDREPVIECVLIEPGKATDLGLFRLRPLAEIRAKVVDDEGKPARVMFNVFPLDRYEVTRMTLDRRFFRSEADGKLEIDSVGQGHYLILAKDEGWVSLPTVADTTLGVADGIEIRVSKGTEVTVRLRAQPLPAARLEIRTRSGVPVVERKCRDLDPMRFVLVPGNYSIELWDGENWIASESLTVATEPLRLYFPK